MAKPSELRRKIDALLDEHTPLIRDAFLLSIADIRSQITLKLVVEALERRDIGGALDALNRERAAFNRVENAIAQAYNAGGTAMTGNMPTLRDRARRSRLPISRRSAQFIPTSSWNLGARRWRAPKP